MAKRKKTFGKQKLVDIIAKKDHLTKARTSKIISDILVTIRRKVTTRRNVCFPKFGSWSLVQYQARMGRNPQNGKAMHIPAHKHIRFKAGKQFRAAKN